MSIKTGIRSLSSGLTPIRKIDPQVIHHAVRHPIQTYKERMTSRQCQVLVFSSNGVDFEMFAALIISQIVWAEELGLGWVVLPGSEKSYAGNRTYVCHPDIPYTLNLHPSAIDYSPHKEMLELIAADDKELIGLGLPKNLLKLTCAGLARIASEKWMAGFDESGGSGLVFLFGAAISGMIFFIAGILVTYATLVLFAAFTK